jgi:murein DD-endopeptidase MepM/ murein hydrolase activator NlpD
MRPWLLAPVVALLALPAPATADIQTGGASAPSVSGGTEYGAPTPKPRRRPARAVRLVASAFSVDPGTIEPGGEPVTIAYRIDGPSRRVRLRVDIVPAGGHRPALRRRLGWKRTGVRYETAWSLAAGTLPAGDYVARLHAVDDTGRTLRRTATASGRLPVKVFVAPAPAPTPAPAPLAVAPVPAGSFYFPVTGTAWNFGGDDARFGADRNGHIHQGQDVMAPEGTPIVSVRGGTVFWKAVQKSGAGNYLVIRGDDARDYVYMHLVAGSETVAKGDPVVAGQQIGQVGTTGRTDGAHLHFEIWPNGWYAKDSHPIDPRPELESWAAAAGGAPPA